MANVERSEASDFLKDEAFSLLTGQLSIVEARGLYSAEPFVI